MSNTFPVCNHGNATMESNCKGNRLEIVQWREYGDDEDSLSVELQPAGSEVDVLDLIADDHDLIRPAEDDMDPDQEGRTVHIETVTIHDGDVIESRGRKFRVNITELKPGTRGEEQAETREP